MKLKNSKFQVQVFVPTIGTVQQTKGDMDLQRGKWKQKNKGQLTKDDMELKRQENKG